jgi:hypothetical protein
LKAQLAAKERVLDSNKQQQKQTQDEIDCSTLTQEGNNRTIQEPLDKQENHTVDTMRECLTQHKDVSTRTLEAIKISKWVEKLLAININRLSA